MANIAFIGLGNMGGPMAANLVKAGHKVTAFDLVAASRDQAKADGADIAETSVASVKGAEIVVTMLPAGKHVLSVWNEVIPAMTKGTLIIDCSTIDVASTSSGQCWALTSYCPVPGPVPASPANNGYKPGFASALMVKDLTLAQDAANAAGAATPLGKHAQEIYKAFDAAGHGGVDFSGIIQHVRSLAGK